ncbi:GerAB/ArcD/ProY family transporter [Neobacillus cucumis]|uniref:GerAB/ArcD/ProY family transporter n=1 Tax=Neobacillus cucumis TaxID=1740721 RepID=UPI002E1FD436|nr:GerAB/ArcD/ProY family transporter [Neobacillus cucumis]MED4226229.1 GerAB/ArcD/ProY family transporter [Neobacillus cucumis]
MEKVQINLFQMFILVLLFETGTSILFGLGSEAKQDAWISILFGGIGGILLFIVYYTLYKYYPDIPFTSYVQKIIGKWVGRYIAYIYIVYFLYQASRILRDFGELLVTTTYNNTPLLIINTMMIITMMYGVHKGIEVIARVGELCFLGIYVLSIVGFVLIVISGIVHLENIKPILENGWGQVLKTVILG